MASPAIVPVTEYIMNIFDHVPDPASPGASAQSSTTSSPNYDKPDQKLTPTTSSPSELASPVGL